MDENEPINAGVMLVQPNAHVFALLEEDCKEEDARWHRKEMCPEQVYLQKVIQWNFLEVKWNFEPTCSAGVPCTRQWLDMSPNDVHVLHLSTGQKPYFGWNSIKMRLFPRRQEWKEDHWRTHLRNEFYIIKEAAQERADLLMRRWLASYRHALCCVLPIGFLGVLPYPTTPACHNLKQLEACCQQRVQRRGMGLLASVLSKVCIRQIHSCRPHTLLAIVVFLLSVLYRRRIPRRCLSEHLVVSLFK